jgi:hypothetical protein
LSRIAFSIGDRSEVLAVEKKRTGMKRFLRLALTNSVTGVSGVIRQGAGSEASDTNDANPQE